MKFRPIHTISKVFLFPLFLAALFVLSAGLILADDEGGEFDDEHVPGELIVKFKGGGEPFRVVTLPAGKSIREADEEFEARGDVEYAEPNYLAHTFFVPNDPYYSLQWHLQNSAFGGVQTETAWDVSQGTGVTVAIVDTGIAFENYRDPRTERRYYKAPDLATTCFVSGYDFVENDSHPNDDNSHGTHVAGTVAQSTDNSTGVAGVSFKSCLMPVKVLDRNGSGTYANVAKGIRLAADNGAKVINLSLGGPAASQTLLDAVAYAYAKGATVVAAAGNDGASVISYPAAYDDYVIAVGATRYDETLAYYSNFGPSLDVVAPGGDLTVDQNGDGYADGVLQNTFNPNTKSRSDFGYWFFQGTSMATPHVAGVAALVISKGNAVLPADVRKALESTAEDLGTAGRDNTFGHGLVDAARAVSWTPGPVDNPPSVSITNPLNGATVIGTINVTANAVDDAGVNRVEFFVDDVLAGSDTAAPYEVSWNSTAVADGPHTIKAAAFDTKSQSSSHSVNVLVDNINNSPVANGGPDKTVSDADGNGFESVVLDGSASFDPDGTIVAYEWREGATILGTTVAITQNFAVGAHTITLRVTDNKGAGATDTALITILANQAPVANAGPDKSAVVGESLTFNGSGSSDPDGSLVSYIWDFGDGTGASGVSVSHAYTQAGTYTATLTVTDNGGLSSVDSAVVTVSPAPALNIVIERIDTRDATPGSEYYVRVYVRNNENTSYQVTGRLAIVDPAGSNVLWPGMNDKSVTVSSGSTASIRWRDTAPPGAAEGVYTAKVDILYQGTVLATSQKTFIVSGSVSSDSD